MNNENPEHIPTTSSKLDRDTSTSNNKSQRIIDKQNHKKNKTQKQKQCNTQALTKSLTRFIGVESMDIDNWQNLKKKITLSNT